MLQHIRALEQSKHYASLDTIHSQLLQRKIFFFPQPPISNIFRELITRFELKRELFVSAVILGSLQKENKWKLKSINNHRWL